MLGLKHNLLHTKFPIKIEVVIILKFFQNAWYHTLHQHSVLSLGRLESQLVKSDDLSPSLQNTSPGPLCDVESTQLKTETSKSDLETIAKLYNFSTISIQDYFAT